ncbi:hypothetical protein pb186bvf_008123 [Paramecium bursaria]
MKHKPILPKIKLQRLKHTPSGKQPNYPGFDDHKLEKILEERKLQRQLMDLVNPMSDDAIQSISEDMFATREKDLYQHYKSSLSQPSLLREKALKGLYPFEQKQYRYKELSKLDKKVQIINERSPLDEEWRSPFLSQNKITTLRSINYQEITKSNNLQSAEMTEVFLNENFRGWGSRLRSYLDYDKHNIQPNLNPKNSTREYQIQVIKRHTSKYLELVKQWNELEFRDKLAHHEVLRKEPTQQKLQQFGTVSSISQYQSIQDFHKKQQLVPKQTQQNTPSQPLFVVRNSRQSNSSGKDLQFDFGKTLNYEQVIEMDEEKQIIDVQISDDISISKDTFLVYCSIFWDLMRKEDEIVERIVYAICKGDRITFNGFKRFYKLFVFQTGEIEEYIKFTYDFFMGKERDEIPFQEIQGLLKLLAYKIDSKLKHENTLSNQILLDILNQIHRPQSIQKDILWQLIQEDKIPPTIITRMLYD